MEDSQEICTTSFSTSPPSQVAAGKDIGVTLIPVQSCYGAEHPAAASTPGSSAPPQRPGEDGRIRDPRHSLETFTRKVGAFVNKPNSQGTKTLDLPFAAFTTQSLEEELLGLPPDSPLSSSPLQTSLHSQGSEDSAPQQDDFVMVDIKPAFSKDGLLPMDLGAFYREFQNPPQLASLSLPPSSQSIQSIQSMADDLDSLPEKLALYEQNIDEFDAFVDMLQ